MQRQQSELHRLLRDAFEGWGSADYFSWKYSQYPDYDPAADNFTITNDEGRTVAARRLFRHQLHTPAGTVLSVHIHGGTAVAEAYRGRGYYSTLLTESMELSEREADIVLTFNRAGKITTQHHKENGWNWIRLPIFASIISPSRVFSQYIVSNEAIKKSISNLSIIDRKLTKNGTISSSVANIAQRIYGDSERMTDETTPIFGSNTRLAGNKRWSRSDYTISRIDGDPSGSVATELSEQLQTQFTDTYHFNRSPERLRHCLSYPQSTVFIAREDDTKQVLDFVVTGMLQKGSFTECRVLEQSWSHPAITQQLFTAVDSYGRAAGADVIVACSNREPGPNWVPLGTEYMMWSPEATDHQLPTTASEWRVTPYDIL